MPRPCLSALLSRVSHIPCRTRFSPKQASIRLARFLPHPVWALTPDARRPLPPPPLLLTLLVSDTLTPSAGPPLPLSPFRGTLLTLLRLQRWAASTSPPSRFPVPTPPLSTRSSLSQVRPFTLPHPHSPCLARLRFSIFETSSLNDSYEQAQQWIHTGTLGSTWRFNLLPIAMIFCI